MDPLWRAVMPSGQELNNTSEQRNTWQPLLQLRACLEDADVPLMVRATGTVFKASTGLLKSVSSPFESLAVTESIREIWPDQELRAWLNTRLYIHILYCFVWIEMQSLGWGNCIPSSASQSNTCRFGFTNALERVCECLINFWGELFFGQRITFLAPVLMHAM